MMMPAVTKPAGVSTPRPATATSDQMPKTPRTKKNMMPCTPPRYSVGNSSVDHSA